MKKRMGLLLMAVVLVTAALASMPAMASGPLTCHPPACFIGPGCCTDAQCSAFCQDLRPGSVPHCSDQEEGGCCSCDVIEIGVE